MQMSDCPFPSFLEFKMQEIKNRNKAYFTVNTVRCLIVEVSKQTTKRLSFIQNLFAKIKNTRCRISFSPILGRRINKVDYLATLRFSVRSAHWHYFPVYPNENFLVRYFYCRHLSRA